MAPASFCCSKAKASNTSAVFIWISLRHGAENPSEASEAHYELRQCVRHQRDNELCRHPIFWSIKQFYSNKWEKLWINRFGSCIRLTCLEASDAADILFWCVYLFMLISPAGYPAEATTANMSAVEQKKLLLKRITVKSTNSGTGAAFLPKYLIWLRRLTPHDCIWIFHEGIQYCPSYKEISSQSAKNHKHSSNTACKQGVQKHRDAGVFVFLYKKEHDTAQERFSSCITLAAIMWEAWTTKKKILFFFLDERKQNESISGEIGWPVERD